MNLAAVGALTGTLGFAYVLASVLEPRVWLLPAVGNLIVAVVALATKPVDYYIGYTLFFIDWASFVVMGFALPRLVAEDASNAVSETIVEAPVYNRSDKAKRVEVRTWQEIVQVVVYMNLLSVIVASFFVWQDAPVGTARAVAFSASLIVAVCTQIWSNLNLRARIVAQDQGLRVHLPFMYGVAFSLHSVNLGIFLYGAQCGVYQGVVVAAPLLASLAFAFVDLYVATRQRAHQVRVAGNVVEEPTLRMQRWWSMRLFFEMQWFCWYGIFNGFPHSVSEPETAAVLAFASIACAVGSAFALYSLRRAWIFRKRVFVHQ